MSESTPSGTEQNPFTRPGFIISAALVLALIAAVAVIFFLPKDDSTAQPAPAAPADTSAPAAPATSAAAAGKSICGLPSTSETALGAAPTSTWELVGKMAAPTDPTTIGPGTTDEDGFRSCFAHTPTGALYAAANIVALGSSPDQDEFKLADQLLVPGPGRDAAMKNAQARTSSIGKRRNSPDPRLPPQVLHPGRGRRGPCFWQFRWEVLPRSSSASMGGRGLESQGFRRWSAHQRGISAQ